MINRMTRAAQLNVELYEEVEHDPSLNKEALNVVLIVSALGGIGALLAGIIAGNIGAAIGGGIVTVILGVARWYLWSYLTLFVGTKLFSGTADYGEVSRVIAYAYTPASLGVFAFVPGVGPLLSFAGSIWGLVCGVVGIRQALDFDTGKAIATVLIAGIIAFVVIAIATAIVLVPFGIASMMF